MGLNKSTGNMYPFLDWTWNPIAGECPIRCSYCSTNKIKRYPVIAAKYSGDLRLEQHQLCPMKNKGFIFVCSQQDLFCADSKDILAVLDHCRKYDENKYLFQSKNTKEMYNATWLYPDRFPTNRILCTTLENDTFIHRAKYFNMIKDSKFVKHVTIEPVMKFDLNEFVSMLREINPAQINIGADSGGNNLIEPTSEEILSLISELEKFTKVVQKENLKRLLP